MAGLICGKNVVKEAMNAGRRFDVLHIQKNTNNDIVEDAKKQGIHIVVHDQKNEMNDLFGFGHQGVGAEVEEYVYVPLETALKKDKTNKLYVMLDGLKDPHNLGAILRSCDAFNADAVIVPKNRSVGLNETVAKVSTGSIEYVDVIQVTNLNNTIKTLKERGFWVVGTDMNTNQTIHDIQVDTDLCIVIGSEGKGISRLVRENCDYVVKIPMNGHVNSLNASVSAAITLYEVFHKRG